MPDDFISTNTQLSYEPDGIPVQCVNISIVGDSILENNEFFLVNLTTEDSAVILSPSKATINIINDDSKLTCCCSVGLTITLYVRVYWLIRSNFLTFFTLESAGALG